MLHESWHSIRERLDTSKRVHLSIPWGLSVHSLPRIFARALAIVPCRGTPTSQGLQRRHLRPRLRGGLGESRAPGHRLGRRLPLGAELLGRGSRLRAGVVNLHQIRESSARSINLGVAGQIVVTNSAVASNRRIENATQRVRDQIRAIGLDSETNMTVKSHPSHQTWPSPVILSSGQTQVSPPRHELCGAPQSCTSRGRTGTHRRTVRRSRGGNQNGLSVMPRRPCCCRGHRFGLSHSH